MTRQDMIFQPGAVLHEAVIGGLRANGTNFSAWCRENGITGVARAGAPEISVVYPA